VGLLFLIKVWLGTLHAIFSLIGEQFTNIIFDTIKTFADFVNFLIRLLQFLIKIFEAFEKVVNFTFNTLVRIPEIL
jgi:hypothetical protein